MGTICQPLPESRPAPAGRLNMADALFGGTQQRVLALLFGQPDRSFRTNEVIASVGAGRGVVQRELEKLVRSELVSAESSGNQRHFKANVASPIFVELQGIVLKTMGLAGPLRHALAPLSDRIRAAFVFGSVAKRADGASSDIDLMIVSDEVTYADVFEALDEVSAVLGRTVNPTIYALDDLKRRLHRGDSFATRVLQQPKIWLIGDERALTA